MKKNFMFVALAAMMLTGVMTACSQEKVPYEGYQKTENGLYYRFYSKNEGVTPQIGELIDVQLGCVVNDTMPVIPVMPNTLQLMESMFPGDIFEGLAMTHAGDSVSFIVNIDSTFRTFFGQPTLPEQFKSTDVMRFDIRIDDIYPESLYLSRMAAKNKKAVTERVAKMVADHAEESAQAAQALTEYLAKKKIVAEPTKSGLYYVMTQPGNGEKPVEGQLVSVHYTGTLLDGTKFDSSYDLLKTCRDEQESKVNNCRCAVAVGGLVQERLHVPGLRADGIGCIHEVPRASYRRRLASHWRWRDH